MDPILDILKTVAPYLITFGGGVLAVYKFWFKASTEGFATKTELRALEVKMDRNIVELKDKLVAMEGDLKLHIKLTEVNMATQKEYLQRVEEQQKDLRVEFDKQFTHLINNIRTWNESKQTHNLTRQIALKMGVSEET